MRAPHGAITPVAAAGQAGYYSGSLKEDGELSRSAVLIVETDGKFELRASDRTKTDGTMTTRVSKSLP